MSWGRGFFGFHVESSFGGTVTSPYPTLTLVPFSTANMGETETPAGVSAQGETAPEYRRGVAIGEVDVQYDPNPEAFGYLLTGIFGIPHSVQVSNSFYLHEFEFQPDAPTFTTYLAWESQALAGFGSRFISLNTRMTPNQYLHVRTRAVCQEVRPWAVESLTLPTDYFGADGPPCTEISASFAEPFGTAVRISDVVLSIGLGISPLFHQTFGGRVGGFYLTQPPTADITFTLDDPTSAWLNYCRDSMTRPFRVQTSLTSYALEFYFPAARIQTNVVGLSIRPPQMTGDTEMFSSPTVLHGLRVSLTNQTSQYF